jgi:hypothetical protein
VTIKRSLGRFFYIKFDFNISKNLLRFLVICVFQRIFEDIFVDILPCLKASVIVMSPQGLPYVLNDYFAKKLLQNSLQGDIPVVS